MIVDGGGWYLFWMDCGQLWMIEDGIQWLWMVVDHRGWLWVIVDVCG